MIEVLVLYHARGIIMAELFHLPSYVSKESIDRPSSNDYDCIDWNIVQVYGHRCSTVDGVCTDVFYFEAESIFADECCCCSKG